MKKKILLIGAGAAGAVAGLLYALETNWRKQKSDANNSTDSASSRRKTPDDQLANRNSSNGERKASASGARIEEAKSSEGRPEPEIDDLGTGQSEASKILQDIRDSAFEASNEKLALALGRPTEEIEEWTNGNGPIDGDVVMKARTLAIQRGLNSTD